MPTQHNVRLQARAVYGASPCKPLFGGTRTLTALSREAANGQKLTVANDGYAANDLIALACFDRR